MQAGRVHTYKIMRYVYKSKTIFHLQRDQKFHLIEIWNCLIDAYSAKTALLHFSDEVLLDCVQAGTPEVFAMHVIHNFLVDDQTTQSLSRAT